MSMVIQVSYEEDRELLAVTERLRDLPLKVSRKPYRSGRFRRCYLRTKDLPRDAIPENTKYPSA